MRPTDLINPWRSEGLCCIVLIFQSFLTLSGEARHSRSFLAEPQLPVQSYSMVVGVMR